MLFDDRQDAGQQLAQRLRGYAGRGDTLVLALPRGGVPVGYEVALALGAPLDVFVVRKLGVPQQRELAMGAIASGGIVVVNHEVLDALQLPESVIETAALYAREEMERQERAFRGERPEAPIAGRVVLLVDDGLATGSTMRAAVRAVRAKKPQRTIVAVPVGAPTTCAELAREADEVVCLETPQPFSSVGQWYRDFTQTEDDEVRECLRRAQLERATGTAG
jgi:putative phosphoribosyl transferase